MLEELKKILSRINSKADWVGLRHVNEMITVLTAKRENIEDKQISIDKGIMVEVIVNGQFGYYATNNISQLSIQNAVDYAVDLAQKAYDHRLFSFNHIQHRPKSIGKFSSHSEIPFDSLSTSEMCDRLIQSSKAMKVSDKIINTTSSVMLIETDIDMVSTNGSEIQQKLNLITTNLNAVAQDGNIIQTRSSGSLCNQGGLEFFSLENLKKSAEKIGKEVLELLSAEECPNDKLDLILMPDQLYLQVHESIGHPLELDRILGDERNYAGWSFVKLEDFGKLQYGSPLLNVTFDPTIDIEYASYSHDDTGAQASKEYLIKDGKLLRALGGLESQARSSIPGVANSRASSWNRPPIDRIANINIEPGTNSLQDMIESIENGIIMYTNKSWSIDDYRNKFQFGCEYAKLIKNGKVNRVVKNPNYRGITTDFWNNLKMVGDNSTFEIWGSPYCGKGEPNQCIRVGHAVPSCLFTSIDVFGGGN